jgi:DNA-binding transcriptional regulator WhiA
MKTKKYSVEEVEFIKKQRGRISVKRMAEELGRSYCSVQTKIYKLGLGVNGRIYSPNVNMSFFENWSQELAYVVGFFLADGHMSEQPKSQQYRICFSVKDKDIVEKIANVCEYKNTVKKYIHKTTVMYSINISGKLVWNFFKSLGFSHNKTFTTRIPKQIPQELMHHFIRGVFDGDGSIGFKNDRYPQAVIAGSNLFIDDVSKLDIEYSGISSQNNRTFAICYNGQKAIDFLNYIYEDATIHMDRKHKRYLKALKWRNSRNAWADNDTILLKKIYPVNSARVTAKTLNRSLSSIQQKAHRIGIKKIKKEKA